MMLNKISIAGCALVFSASVAVAAPVLIDDFTDFQVAADLPTSTAGSPSFATGSMIGGSRVFEVENTTPSPPLGAGSGSGGSQLTSTGNGQTFQQTPENTLIFVNNTSQTGRATVTYDGRANLADAGSTFGPVDLTGGGTNVAFFFDLVQDTPNFVGTTFTTTVSDSDSTDTVVELLDAGFTPFTFFNLFPTIDFTDVVSLTFSFDTNELAGFDGGISSISAVPLPLSSLLVLGGLGGLAGATAASKRRRRKAA